MSLNVWVEELIKGNEKPLPIPKEKTMLNGIYIDEAIKSHVEWRENWFNSLRAHNTENYDVSIVAADNLCKVGKWIYSSGKIYEGIPEYEALKKKHAEFHCCAGDAVKEHNAGHLIDSMMIVKGQLQNLSLAVGLSFISLLEATQK